MDFYKKKSLKFSNEQVSRASRQAETLKARESSRFERLSMIRSCNDSTFLEDENEENVVPITAENIPEVPKQKDHSSSNLKFLSVPKREAVGGLKQMKGKLLQIPQEKEIKLHQRMERLYKWKEDKALRQELEKQKKKPFYVGAKPPPSLLKVPSTIKPLQNFKSSFMSQKNGSTISSNMSRSRFLAPPSQIAKPPLSSKQPAPRPAVIQPPRVPYNFKAAATLAIKPPNSGNRMNNVTVRKPVSSTTVPAAKSIIKPTTNGKKEVIPTFKKPTLQNSASTYRSPVPKPSYGLNRFKPGKNLQAPVLKNTKTNENNSSKISNQGSLMPKYGISKVVNKQAQKMPPPGQITKPNTFKLPNKPVGKVKPFESSNIGRSLKKPTTATKQDLSAKFKKTPSNQGSNDKVSVKKKEAPSSEKLPELSLNADQQPGKSTDSQTVQSIAKPAENFVGCIESKDSEKSLPLKSVESVPDITFNCDVSSIAPSNSFAPMDFKFQPPVFCSFFEDDPFEAIEWAKQHFMSRTSTPSRDVTRASKCRFTPTKHSIGGKSIVEDEKIIGNQSCETTSSKRGEKGDKASEKRTEISSAEDLLNNESPGILVTGESMEEIDDKPNKTHELVDFILSSESLEKDTGDVDKLNTLEIENFDALKDIVGEDSQNRTVENGNCDVLVKKAIETFGDSPKKFVENENLDVKKSVDENSPDKLIGNENYDTLGKNTIDGDTPNKSIEKEKNYTPVKKTVDEEFPNKSTKNKNDVLETILKSETADEYEPTEQKANNDNIASESLTDIMISTEFLEDNIISTESSDQRGVLMQPLIDVSASYGSLETDVVRTKPQALISMSPEKFDLDEIKQTIEIQQEQINLEDDSEGGVSPLQSCAERKSTGAISKRVSIFKRVSILNSIAEASEATAQSPLKSSKKPFLPGHSSKSSRSTPQNLVNSNNHQSPINENDVLISLPNTPRRSLRLSRSVPQHPDNSSNHYSPIKEDGLLISLLSTPRRSSRLSGSIHHLDNSKKHESPVKEDVHMNRLSTPRRSSRLFHAMPQLTGNPSDRKSPIKEGVLISVTNTPRRSLRLQKPIHKSLEDVNSPSDQKLLNATPRRSMRLRNPSTPGSASGLAKTDLTIDFDRMRISSSENKDPNDLIDFAFTPEPLAKENQRKVSLLYAPDRRKSIRKSIRGDLMSFSPSGN